MRPTAPLLLLAVLCPAAAAAQAVDTATLNANLGGIVRISLSTTSLAFPDANPTTVPQVAALPGPVTITVRARASAGGQVLVTVQATDDVRSGISTLPAATITWTGSGAGFVNGTLSRTSPQTVASWTGSGVRTGTQSFFFQNLWTHPTGTYTVVMVYTVSAA